MTSRDRQILGQFSDATGRLSGASISLFEQDRRDTADMLSEWQRYSGIADTNRFIKDKLELEGLLSDEQFKRLLTRQATPGSRLGLHLSMRIPAHVATRRKFLSRCENDQRRGSKETVELEQEDFFKQKEAMALRLYGTDLSSAHTNSSSAEQPVAFYDDCVAHLHRVAAHLHRGFDEEQATENLARYLGLSTESLTGRGPPPRVGDREEIAQKFASLLSLDEPSRYQELYDSMARHLEALVPVRPSILQFCRQYEGLSRREWAEKISAKMGRPYSEQVVEKWESGWTRPPPAIKAFYAFDSGLSEPSACALFGTDGRLERSEENSCDQTPSKREGLETTAAPQERPTWQTLLRQKSAVYLARQKETAAGILACKHETSADILKRSDGTLPGMSKAALTLPYVMKDGVMYRRNEQGLQPLSMEKFEVSSPPSRTPKQLR